LFGCFDVGPGPGSWGVLGVWILFRSIKALGGRVLSFFFISEMDCLKSATISLYGSVVTYRVLLTPEISQPSESEPSQPGRDVPMPVLLLKQQSDGDDESIIVFPMFTLTGGANKTFDVCSNFPKTGVKGVMVSDGQIAYKSLRNNAFTDFKNFHQLAKQWMEQRETPCNIFLTAMQKFGIKSTFFYRVKMQLQSMNTLPQDFDICIGRKEAGPTLRNLMPLESLIHDEEIRDNIFKIFDEIDEYSASFSLFDRKPLKVWVEEYITHTVDKYSAASTDARRGKKPRR
jgi:hypothetical protein